jgi:hypothetical protein
MHKHVKHARNTRLLTLHVVYYAAISVASSLFHRGACERFHHPQLALLTEVTHIIPPKKLLRSQDRLFASGNAARDNTQQGTLQHGWRGRADAALDYWLPAERDQTANEQHREKRATKVKTAQTKHGSRE